jgi:hypothetical protein
MYVLCDSTIGPTGAVQEGHILSLYGNSYISDEAGALIECMMPSSSLPDPVALFESRLGTAGAPGTQLCVRGQD